MWRIVKYENHVANKTNCYKLEQEDVIKFGRVRFKVKKLVIDQKEIDKIAHTNSQVDERDE